jgi:hypothetical protein
MGIIKAKPSAFRAINITVTQDVTADVPVIPVQYPTEIFDLNDEYDPLTSTFTPKQDGVYLVIASVNFNPPTVDGVIIPTNYRVLTLIRVNGIPVVSDNDFFGEIPIGAVSSVSSILPLQAGDSVNVATSVSTDGTIIPNPFAPPTRFEAARFPSPLDLMSLSISNTSNASFNSSSL